MCKPKGSVPGGLHRCSNHARKEVEQQVDALQASLSSKDTLDRGVLQERVAEVQKTLQKYAATHEGTLALEQFAAAGAQGLPAGKGSEQIRDILFSSSRGAPHSDTLDALLVSSRRAQLIRAHQKVKASMMREMEKSMSELISKAEDAKRKGEPLTQAAQELLTQTRHTDGVKKYFEKVDAMVTYNSFFDPDHALVWPRLQLQSVPLSATAVREAATEHAKRVRQAALEANAKDESGRKAMHEVYTRVTQASSQEEAQQIMGALDPQTRRQQERYNRSMDTYLKALPVMHSALQEVAKQKAQADAEYRAWHKKRTSVGARVRAAVRGTGLFEG